MRAVFTHCFFGRGNTSTIHQADQFAKRHSLGNHSLTVGFVANVALNESTAQFFGDSLAFFGLHVRNDHFAAMGCQHAGCAFA